MQNPAISASTGPAGLADTITEENIILMVHAFYERVQQHEVLGPVFNPALKGRWDQHQARMIDFWSSVLLQSGRYRGHPVRAHFMVRGMKREQFADWLALFQETLDTIYTPEPAQLIHNAASRMAGRMTEVLFDQFTMMPSAETGS